jgi:hypothetical protein
MVQLPHILVHFRHILVDFTHTVVHSWRMRVHIQYMRDYSYLAQSLYSTILVMINLWHCGPSATHSTWSSHSTFWSIYGTIWSPPAHCDACRLSALPRAISPSNFYPQRITKGLGITSNVSGMPHGREFLQRLRCGGGGHTPTILYH